MADFKKYYRDFKDSSGTQLGSLFLFLAPLLFLKLIPDYAMSPRLYWGILFLSYLLILSWVFRGRIFIYIRRIFPWFSQKNQKLKVVLAIYNDLDSETSEFEEDFYKELRAVMKNGNLGGSIDLIQASSGESRDVDSEKDLIRILDRYQANFLIYGRVRTRQDSDGLNHFAEFRAIVRHAELQSHVQKAFQNEISSVFPVGKIRIPKSDQLPQFKLTADWLGFSSRYIISLAAFTVGDVDYSDQLLVDAGEILIRLPRKFVQERSLQTKLHARRYENSSIKAQRLHSKWRRDRSSAIAKELLRELEVAEGFGSLSQELIQLKAQAVFIESFDAAYAERLVRSAMFNHAIVQYNLGFLLAWQGKFNEARKCYKSAAKKNPSKEDLDQIYTFLSWLMKIKPDCQFNIWWCEAMVRIYLKDDLEKANRIIGILSSKTEVFPESEIRSLRMLIGSD